MASTLKYTLKKYLRSNNLFNLSQSSQQSQQQWQTFINPNMNVMLEMKTDLVWMLTVNVLKDNGLQDTLVESIHILKFNVLRCIFNSLL